jgi:hypothetical protein
MTSSGPTTACTRRAPLRPVDLRRVPSLALGAGGAQRGAGSSKSRTPG